MGKYKKKLLSWKTPAPLPQIKKKKKERKNTYTKQQEAKYHSE